MPVGQEEPLNDGDPFWVLVGGAGLDARVRNVDSRPVVAEVVGAVTFSSKSTRRSGAVSVTGLTATTVVAAVTGICAALPMLA